MLSSRSSNARLQSNFYRDQYRKMLRWLMCAIVIIIVLVLIIIYQILFRAPQRYYANTVEGRILPMPPGVEKNMAVNRMKQRYFRYIPKDNNFYRDYYHYFIIGLMVLIVVLIFSVGFLLYEISHQRLPEFSAIQPKGQTLLLQPYREPNLLPDTIIRFASKAAVAAYSFDFVNFKEDLELARPFFTDSGWQGYMNAAQGLINTIVSSQLFVYGIVSGTPVIANQGEIIPGSGFTWRIQIPFLVTYETATGPANHNYFIVVKVVRVPTSQNPQGIGIDQFTVI